MITSFVPQKAMMALCFALCFTLFVVWVPTTCTAFVVQSPEVEYDDQIGPTVTYSNIVESSATDPLRFNNGTPIGHYGNPSLNGDILSFNAPSFSAQVVSDTGVDLTDGFLSIEMQAAPGTAIESIRLTEFGSITLSSPSGGSQLTLANIDTPVFVTVHDVVLNDGSTDGRLIALSDPVTVSAIMNVSPTRDNPNGWNSLDNPNVRIWNGGLLLNIIDEFANAGINGYSAIAGGPLLPIRGVSRLEYKMNNILKAQSMDSSSAAFIDKKGIYINPFAAAVPEPTGVLLIIPSALLLLMAWRRARRK